METFRGGEAHMMTKLWVTNNAIVGKTYHHTFAIIDLHSGEEFCKQTQSIYITSDKQN